MPLEQIYRVLFLKVKLCSATDQLSTSNRPSIKTWVEGRAHRSVHSLPPPCPGPLRCRFGPRVSIRDEEDTEEERRGVPGQNVGKFYPQRAQRSIPSPLTVSVSTTQVWFCGTKPVTDNRWMSGHSRVPGKLPTKTGGGPKWALGLLPVNSCLSKVWTNLKVGKLKQTAQRNPESHFPSPDSPPRPAPLPPGAFPHSDPTPPGVGWVLS